MRWNSLFLTLGLIGCAVLGVMLLRVRSETNELARAYQDVVAANAAAMSRRPVLQRELAVVPKPDRATEFIGTGRTPAALIRARVAPLVAAIKADHAAHPLPPRRPPPPAGLLGSLFSELLSDPEYNLLVKQSQRLNIAILQQERMEKAGLTPAEVDRVLDLLAEREMLQIDYQSLRPHGWDAALYQQQQAERRRFNEQLRTLLGQERYDQLASNVPSSSVTVHPDGTVTDQATLAREISIYGGDYLSDRIDPLRRRLSYSAEPLSDAQMPQLTALWVATSDYQRTNPWQNAAFEAQARTVLTAAQCAALVELRLEQEADLKRRRLPSR